MLKDFIGKDSWTTFSFSNINADFLKLPVARWETDERYCKTKQMLKNLPMVNDAAKRSFEITTEMNDENCPKDDMHVQALYKVVKGPRRQLYGMATSYESVTKRSLSSIEYNTGNDAFMRKQ